MKPIEKAMTITYPVRTGLYINLTNKCPCACTFCLRQNGSGAYGSDPLWLEHEPSVEEVIESLKSRDMSQFTEIVFCGYGEPTERLPELLEVAAYIKEHIKLPVRINTNGLGNLIWKRDIAPELEGLIDTLSISLNATTPEQYLALTRSKFGIESFQAMLDFAKEAKHYVPNVVMTVVDQVTSKEEQEVSRQICDEIGVTLRIRPLES
ncbi:MAG: TIGR04100 family radical SAM protein [Lachnospiraceae bacterium]|nr:TIGR04100 family radical SAM protein [Lachnospiraceae bacterium]